MAIETCTQCGREHYVPDRAPRPWCGAYATVEHEFHGCDTGCCGHRVYLFDEEGHEVDRSKFEFDHPWSDQILEEFCRELAEEHFPGIPLRLEECDAHDD